MSVKNDSPLYDIEKIKLNFKKRQRIWRECQKDNSWMTVALLESLSLPNGIWDCAAGRGDVCNLLRSFGHETYNSDSYLDNVLVNGASDTPFILHQKTPLLSNNKKIEAIVANPFPPSGHLDQGCTPNDFIHHALSFLNQEINFIALLMRSGFCEGKSRKRRMLFGGCYHYMGELVLTTRPRWDQTDPNAEKDVSPINTASWFLWSKDWKRQNKHPIQLFHYAPEGFKP